MSRRTILNVEAGSHSVGTDSLFSIASALGVKAAELVSDAEADPGPLTP